MSGVCVCVRVFIEAFAYQRLTRTFLIELTDWDPCLTAPNLSIMIVTWLSSCHCEVCGTICAHWRCDRCSRCMCIWCICRSARTSLCVIARRRIMCASVIEHMNVLVMSWRLLHRNGPHPVTRCLSPFHISIYILYIYIYLFPGCTAGRCNSWRRSDVMPFFSCAASE